MAQKPGPLKLRWWSRWYGLVLAAIVVTAILQVEVPLLQRLYKGFYIPSESMAPTLERDDKVVADMHWSSPLQRGQVIIFRGINSDRISRIAAIAGDRVAMRDGIPVINGREAARSARGQITFAGHDGPQSALAFAERLPGETAAHRVIDTGPSHLDIMPEVVVPQDHVFVLGDNRDGAADSRVQPRAAGIRRCRNGAGDRYLGPRDVHLLER